MPPMGDPLRQAKVYPEDPAQLEQILHETAAQADAHVAEQLASGTVDLYGTETGGVAYRTEVGDTLVENHPDGTTTFDGLRPRDYMAAQALSASLDHGPDNIDPVTRANAHPSAGYTTPPKHT